MADAVSDAGSPLDLITDTGARLPEVVDDQQHPSATSPADVTEQSGSGGSGGASFGIAAGSSLPSLSDSELNSELAGIRSLGARWVRFDIEWRYVEPSQGTFNWSDSDRIIAAAHAHGLSVLPIIDYAPGWAASSSCTSICAPSDPATYASFVSATVSRYASKGVHSWEIWNEPNLGQFWSPKSDPAAYAKDLIAASSAIRHIDPSADIVSAGLAVASSGGSNVAPADFLTQLYQNGAGHSFTAVGDHPYTFPVPPATAGSAWLRMAQLRNIMVANGDGAKKIWVTEYGAPTGGPGATADVNNLNLSAQPWHVTEALQAKIATQAVSMARGAGWIAKFFWYSYKDAGNTQDTNENYFGLVRFDGSPKPAFSAFRAAAGG